MNLDLGFALWKLFLLINSISLLGMDLFRVSLTLLL